MRCPAVLNHPPLSVYICLNDYLSRTHSHRESYANFAGKPSDNLFVATTKPFQPVTARTIARWLLAAMDRAGLNTETYKSHSTRAATSSHLVRSGLPVKDILKRAHWSEKSRTFKIFYNRA